MVASAVILWLEEHQFGAVASLQPVGGGCINEGARLVTTSGRTFFLKSNARLPLDAFSMEAEALSLLQVPDGPRFPKPILAGTDFLLLEDLTPAPGRPDFWPELGRRLAALHNHTSPNFGFAHNNYLGSTPQPNPWTEDGFAFFGEQRLMFQARLAERNGYFTSQELALVESLCRRLKDLVPAQPASLLHGDLWSGNVLSDSDGRPALIDPAAYYGWAEAELGMTMLFGGFPQAFYHAYQEARHVQSGWRNRIEIYNLYQLLNHLNLFGRAYYNRVLSILRRWAG